MALGSQEMWSVALFAFVTEWTSQLIELECLTPHSTTLFEDQHTRKKSIEKLLDR